MKDFLRNIKKMGSTVSDVAGNLKDKTVAAGSGALGKASEMAGDLKTKVSEALDTTYTLDEVLVISERDLRKHFEFLVEIKEHNGAGESLTNSFIEGAVNTQREFLRTHWIDKSK